MARGKQHDKQFKLDAVKYRKEHPDLTQEQCAKNLCIGVSTLARWESQFRDYNGDIPTRGSAIMLLMSKRKLPVLNVNSAMHRTLSTY